MLVVLLLISLPEVIEGFCRWGAGGPVPGDLDSFSVLDDREKEVEAKLGGGCWVLEAVWWKMGAWLWEVEIGMWELGAGRWVLGAGSWVLGG